MASFLAMKMAGGTETAGFKKSDQEAREVAAGQEEGYSRDPFVLDVPRTAVDFTEEMKTNPEIASVVRVALNANGSTLTGSLVTRCHVLINLHLISDESGLAENNHLLRLSDGELAQDPKAKVTIGVLPNGSPKFENGYNMHVRGSIVKTGRNSFLLSGCSSPGNDTDNASAISMADNQHAALV